jgi:hypothetical protein
MVTLNRDCLKHAKFGTGIAVSNRAMVRLEESGSLDQTRGESVKGDMRMSKTLGLLLVGAMILGSVGTAAAQAAGGEKSEKKVYYGPSKSAFGKLELVLEQGASSEVEYQPDASRVAIKTLVGEARIISAASYLILVENLEGKVDIKLPNGRIISVEPGKSEIVGRAIADDPGQIVIRFSARDRLPRRADPPGTLHLGCDHAARVRPRGRPGDRGAPPPGDRSESTRDLWPGEPVHTGNPGVRQHSVATVPGARVPVPLGPAGWSWRTPGSQRGRPSEIGREGHRPVIRSTDVGSTPVP